MVPIRKAYVSPLSLPYHVSIVDDSTTSPAMVYAGMVVLGIFLR
jgi:hypothetical protein